MLHRDGDMPAIIYSSGGCEWFKNNMPYRDDDMPLSVHSNGSEEWYVGCDRWYRKDGPTYIGYDGRLSWIREGGTHTHQKYIPQMKKL